MKERFPHNHFCLWEDIKFKVRDAFAWKEKRRQQRLSDYIEMIASADKKARQRNIGVERSNCRTS